jgi:serine/threonine-protein kinase RsbW
MTSSPAPRTPAPPTQILHFRMDSRRTAVGPALERVLEAVQPANLGDERRHDLAVAVAEALSNAAVHGHRLLAEKQVRVIVGVVPNTCAVVVVSDSGPGFNMNDVSDPTDPKRVLVPGGRGVFLMRQLVDRLEYNRAGNRVRLSMERRS